MDFDEERPKKVGAVTIGQALDDLSVDDLIGRLALLKAEIKRVEAEVINKKSTKSQADSVFKI